MCGVRVASGVNPPRQPRSGSKTAGYRATGGAGVPACCRDDIRIAESCTLAYNAGQTRGMAHAALWLVASAAGSAWVVMNSTDQDLPATECANEHASRLSSDITANQHPAQLCACTAAGNCPERHPRQGLLLAAAPSPPARRLLMLTARRVRSGHPGRAITKTNDDSRLSFSNHSGDATGGTSRGSPTGGQRSPVPQQPLLPQTRSRRICPEPWQTLRGSQRGRATQT